MKIRNGFVSNSSSSSFIVAFDQAAYDPDEFKKLLWGDEEEISNYHFTIDVDVLCQIVYNDFRKQDKVTRKIIIETIRDGHYDGKPEYDFQQSRKDNKYDEKYFAEEKKHARGVALKFLAENKDRIIKIFHYGDESGTVFSTLEHCNTFINLPHIRVSYH